MHPSPWMAEACPPIPTDRSGAGECRTTDRDARCRKSSMLRLLSHGSPVVIAWPEGLRPTIRSRTRANYRRVVKRTGLRRANTRFISRTKAHHKCVLKEHDREERVRWTIEDISGHYSQGARDSLRRGNSSLRRTALALYFTTHESRGASTRPYGALRPSERTLARRSKSWTRHYS